MNTLKELKQEDLPLKLIKDLGRLNLIKPPERKERFAIFECPYCKKHFKTRVQRVKSGSTKSCGCHKSPNKEARKVKHE